jgi:hypothetical protein
VTDKGLPQLAKEVANDVKRLLRLEAQLAGEQVKSGMKKRALAAGAGMGALLFILYALLFLLAAAAAGLAVVLAWWLALLIVGGTLFLLALLLVGIAVMSVRSAGSVVPEQSKQSVKEDVRWLREQSS